MPLSHRETRSTLEQLEHLPKKTLGQNFLIDGNIVRKSIDMAEIGPASNVVEIGPGLGTLTQAILDSGARTWAVEKDATLACHIREKLLAHNKRLHLIEGDCLKHPLADLPDEIAASGFKIVANLPYAVSTPWMEAVLSGQLPDRMVLMLQKEAADRYISNHGSKTFGAISIFLQSAYEAHTRHPVSAVCFHPVPKVDSTLLRLDLKKDAIRFSDASRAFIRTVFTQRRKQLGAHCRNHPNAKVQEWFHNLIENGFSSTVRPEELPVEAWSRLKL